MEPKFPCHRTGRDVVVSAEGGEKVVQGHFVRQVDGCEAQAPPVAVTVEYIVVTDTRIKQISRGDSLGVLVVILFPRCRDFDKDRSPPCRTTSGKRRSGRARSRKHSIAGKSDLGFVIGGQKRFGGGVYSGALARG